MKIEVGKYYRTRGGQMAYVSSQDTSTAFPYFGYIEEKAHTWQKDGKWGMRSEGEYICDLIEEWTEPQPKEQTMPVEPKFKVGDKVFHVGLGVGKVIATDMGPDYPVGVNFPRSEYLQEFTMDGRYCEKHSIPQLLTLEEARAKGYDVPKNKVKKWRWLCGCMLEGFYLSDHVTDDFVARREPKKHEFIQKIDCTEITVEES